MMYRIMLKHTIMLVTTFLVGCVPMESAETIAGKIYNLAASGSSQFDGTKYIRMINLVCSNIVMFELYQDTQKAKKGYVLLNAGSKSIDNIGIGKSLHLKINDKKHSFESNDVVTDHETIFIDHGINMEFSHKSYLIPESIIRDVAASNIFLAKVNLLNNTFVEGDCSINESSKLTATAGFQKFVKMMDDTSW